MENSATIEQMNEVIARFDGYEKVRIGYWDEDPSDWQKMNALWMDKVMLEDVGWYAVNVPEDKWLEWEDVKYHSSWDQLMPVVKKIRERHGEFLKQLPHGPYMHAMAKMNGGLISVDLIELHEGVYQFIQWYNKNTTNEQSTNTAG